MIKSTILVAGFLGATATFQACAQVNGGSFDVLASVMENHDKEINAHDVLDANKKKAEQYREKVIGGWWEFMQASSKAGPGEYCAASFLRAKRLTEPAGRADYPEFAHRWSSQTHPVAPTLRRGRPHSQLNSAMLCNSPNGWTFPMVEQCQSGFMRANLPSRVRPIVRIEASVAAPFKLSK